MTLMFDIETVGLDLDEGQRAVLIKKAWKERERTGEEVDPFDSLGLSPFTGRVVVVAAWDDEKNLGLVLTDQAGAVSSPAGWTHQDCGNEAELLARFWSVCSRQRRFCSYNGAGFDVPFLIARSVVHGVKVHKPFLNAKPWEDLHVDLAVKLTPGMRTRGGFDLTCRALSVPSPKDGIDGSQVQAAWNEGRKEEVAIYCCKDVTALAGCLAKYDNILC